MEEVIDVIEDIKDKIAYCKDHFIQEDKPSYVKVKMYELLKNYNSALYNANKGKQEFEIFTKLNELRDKSIINLDDYKQIIVDLDSYVRQVFLLVASSKKVKVLDGKNLRNIYIPREQYKGYIASKNSNKEK